MSAKCPIWGGIELASIRDPYTSAAAGIVHLTAIQLVEFQDCPGCSIPAGDLSSRCLTVLGRTSAATHKEYIMDEIEIERRYTPFSDIEHRILPLLGGFLAKKVGKKLAQKAGGVAVDLLAKNPTGAVIAKGLDDSGLLKVTRG